MRSLQPTITLADCLRYGEASSAWAEAAISPDIRAWMSAHSWRQLAHHHRGATAAVPQQCVAPGRFAAGKITDALIT